MRGWREVRGSGGCGADARLVDAVDAVQCDVERHGGPGTGCVSRSERGEAMTECSTSAAEVVATSASARSAV